MDAYPKGFMLNILHECELLRHEYLRQLKKSVMKYAALFFGISCVLVFLITCNLYNRCMWLPPKAYFFLFLWNLVPTAVVGAILAFKRNLQFKKIIKEKYLPEVLKKLPFITTEKEGFDEAELKKSNLFSDFNQMKFDDIFIGAHKEIPFKIAEMKLLDCSKHSYKPMQFDGIGILFSVFKKFPCHTIIISKFDIFTRNFSLNLFISFAIACFSFFIVPPEQKMKACACIFCFAVALLMRWDMRRQGLGFFVHLEKVNLEDLAFSKRYTVYSEKQIEARRLITPVFMEKLKNIETAFGTRKLKCGFYDHNVMLAISSWRDLFELGHLFKRLDTADNCERFFAELTAVCDMIDYISKSARL